MEEWIALALELGFEKAALVCTKDIPFEPAFRKYCADNVCGNYGTNWSCPPDCGTPEEMERKLKAFPKALVFVTAWKIDYRDAAAVREAKREHNRRARALIGQMPNTLGMMVGASACNLCQVCARTVGEPCRYPEEMASCMSAYCIHVRALSDACGMTYDAGDNTVHFFGMYAFEEI